MKRIIRTSAFKNGFFLNDRFFIVLFVLFSVGLLIGSAAAGAGATDETSVLTRIFTTYFREKAAQNFLTLLLSTFFSNLLTLAIAYALGVCAVGAPLLYLLPVWDGIGRGLIFGFLYLKLGFFGFLKTLLLVAPQNVLLGGTLLLAVRLSHDMALQTFGEVRGVSGSTAYCPYRKYNQRYLFLTFSLMFGAILDALFNRLGALVG